MATGSQRRVTLCHVPRPKTHDDALRVRLLDRAGELLSTQGPSALSLRKLAADVGTSTTAVYSLFGGKPALVRELYVSAFQRFGAKLTDVPSTGDPVDDMIGLGLAYRRGALSDPHLYSIMFGTAMPGFQPDKDAIEHGLAALLPLLEVVERGVKEGLFLGATPREIAISAWGVVHGLVSLELNGVLPSGFESDEAYERAIRANLAGWIA
jgi:AcrR family transcriptional regulator